MIFGWLKSKINLKQDIENLTWILLFCSCLGLLGRFYWFFDLFSHFRVQYIFSACVLGLVGACCKSRQAIGLSGVVLIMNVVFIGAIFLFHTAAPQPIVTSDYRVLSSNVLSRNQNYEFVKQGKFYEDLDAVLLLESNFDWVRETAYLKKDFLHYALHPRADNFGMAFYSRESFDGGIEVFKAPDISDFDMPYVWAEFLGDFPFVFIGVHPPPPVDAEITGLRDAFLMDIAKKIKAAPDKRYVLVGDFNDTLWSYNFRRFLKQTGMKNTAHGLYETWPTIFTGFKIFGLQIDHALVKGFDAATTIIGYDIGSDHLPLVVHLKRTIKVEK